MCTFIYKKPAYMNKSLKVYMYLFCAKDTICKKADENWSYRNKCEIQTTSNKASKSYMRSTVVNKSGNLQKEYQHREDYMNKRKKLQVFHKGNFFLFFLF